MLGSLDDDRKKQPQKSNAGKEWMKHFKKERFLIWVWDRLVNLKFWISSSSPSDLLELFPCQLWCNGAIQGTRLLLNSSLKIVQQILLLLCLLIPWPAVGRHYIIQEELLTFHHLVYSNGSFRAQFKCKFKEGYPSLMQKALSEFQEQSVYITITSPFKVS